MISLQDALTYLYDFVLCSSILFFALHVCMTDLGRSSVKSHREQETSQTRLSTDAEPIAAGDTTTTKTDVVQQSPHPSTPEMEESIDTEQQVIASEKPASIEPSSPQAPLRSLSTDHVVPFVRRRSPYQGWTRRQLLNEAKRVKLPGYSRMKTEALRIALTQYKRKSSPPHSSASVA